LVAAYAVLALGIVSRSLWPPARTWCRDDGCVFRSNVIADSGRTWSPFPFHRDHGFRWSWSSIWWS